MKKPLLYLIVLCLLQINKVYAATCSTNGAGSSWGTAANWSCGHVPISSDNATFNHAITSASSLTFTSSQFVTINNLGSLSITGDLIITGGSVLTINSGGSLTVSGNISFQNGGQLIMNGGTVTINGTVSTSGGSGGSYSSSGIDIESGTMNVGSGPTITSSTNTIDLNNGPFINKGTINLVKGNFNESSSGNVSVNNSGNITIANNASINQSFTNSGTFTVNGNFDLSNAGSATVTNSGTFKVALKSTLGQKFTNTGTFNTTGDLEITSSGSANLTTNSPGNFSVGGNLTNNQATSGLTIGAGSKGTITGDFDNNGTITINGQLDVKKAIINNDSNANIKGIGVIGWKTGFFTTGNGGKVTPAASSGVAAFTTVPSFNPYDLSTGGIGSLPIQLLSFTAQWENNQTMLKWSTTKEDNFDTFIIESSSDAQSFHEIGRVKGNGNTTRQKDYSFKDLEYFSGIRYYRLKTVDLDGSSEYFKMVSVQSNAAEDFLMYPNPVKDQPLFIFIKVDNATNRLVIYNKVGLPVFESNLQPGLNEISLQNRLTPDVYYTVVTTEAGTQRSKLVVE